MNQVLQDAYLKISHKEPDRLAPDWVLADYLANNFDMRKLGPDLAEKTIFTIVNHVDDYPDDDTTRRIVGKAEDLAEEMGIAPEGHMADIERAEYHRGDYFR